MKQITVNGAGELVLVAAIWRRALADAESGLGEIEIDGVRLVAPRDFLLDAVALDNLESLGLDRGAVRMLVEGDVDVAARRRRDVMRMWEGGVEMTLIVEAVTGQRMGYHFMMVSEIIQGVISEGAGADGGAGAS